GAPVRGSGGSERRWCHGARAGRFSRACARCGGRGTVAARRGRAGRHRARQGVSGRRAVDRGRSGARGPRRSRRCRRCGRRGGRPMRLIMIAGAVALIVAIVLTPILIKLFSRQGFGQEIRVEGPEAHRAKRGTPTMGGVAIIVGMWAGYWGAHAVGVGLNAEGPSASGLLVLGLATVLGIVGFLDDFLKVRKQRNLGLNKTAKTVGQLVAAVIFAVLVLR